MNSERYVRQSFLGENSEELIAQTRVAVVGLGGGGSHIVQQLAHIGFQNYILFDHDTVAESNLNRLVGAKFLDAPAKTPKLDIAEMMILGLQPDANIQSHSARWQDQPLALRSAHLVFGAVDTYRGRDELERCCRRYYITYIDIGMDVVCGTDGRCVIGGQVIASLPDQPCMWCMRYLTKERMDKEGAAYGDAGGNPQVIWSNGVLASTAVGLGVGLITDWSRQRGPVYLEYDGNRGTLKPRPSVLSNLPETCPHYPPDDVGDPVLRFS